MKISDYQKCLLVGGTLLTGIPWVINFSYSPSLEEWFGFLGNYIGALMGGIIGALVAYFIARQQIEELKKQEVGKKKLEQYSAVAPLMVGLELIEKGYQAIINLQKITKEPTMDKFRGLCDISEQAWERIYLLTDINLQDELLRVKNQYMVDYGVMMESCIDLKKEDIAFEKKKNKNKNYATKEEEDLVNGEANMRKMLIMVMIHNKKATYDNAEKNLKNVQKLKTKINKLSDTIKNNYMCIDK